MLEFSKRLGICLGIVASFALGACGGDESSDNSSSGEEKVQCDPACGENQECVDGTCKDKESTTTKDCTEDADCKDDTKECKDGKCVAKGGTNPNPDDEPAKCESPNKTCGTACVNVQTSLEHCGDCDKACAVGQVCESGTCKWNCGSGQEECSDGCHDLQNDADNCGSCGNKCNAEDAEGDDLLTCNAGQCTKDCGGQTLCGTSCVDTATDNANCGACGTVCKAEENMFCNAGQCKKTCPAGTSECGSDCFDLDSDKDHCGDCNKACTGNDVCIEGECGSKCQENETECSDGCFDVKKDKNHCGSCDNACTGDDVCSNGECVMGCPDNQVPCNGACIDPKTDQNFCGAKDNCSGENAGKACPSSSECSEGECKCPNDAPNLCQISESESVCVNASTSAEYCGCGSRDNEAGMNCSALPNTKDVACVEGACNLTEESCNDGFAHCSENLADGCEVNLMTDTNNCGGCGNVCSNKNASATACLSGKCSPTCKSGFTACNGECLDLSEDTNNCGWCGNKCGEGQVCNDGFCQVEQCGNDGYVYLTMNAIDSDGTLFEQTVKAYCITNNNFLAMRDAINSKGVYPNTGNSDHAYILTGDVSLGEVAKWEPIGTSAKPFTGYFSGNGHKIVGNIQTVGHYTGLFGYVQDSVLDSFNLSLSLTGNPDVTRDDNFRALQTTGVVDYPVFQHTAGLVGYATNSVVTRNVNTGNVTCSRYCGSLIGTAHGSYVAMNRSSGTLSSNEQYVGGIAGYVGTKTQVKQCESSAKITSHNSKKYTKNNEGIYELNGSNYSWYPNYYGGILGCANASTVTDVKSTGVIKNEKAGIADHNGGIIGLMQSSTLTDSFSSVEINTNGRYDMGGLVGIMQKSTIKNSHATGKMKGSYRMGGLVGLINSSGPNVIENCTASGAVEGSYWTGGLVGRIEVQTEITNCSASGDVKGSSYTGGGLVGRMDKTTVRNCFATGNVTTLRVAGGLVGVAVDNSVIEDSYAKGTVTTTTSDTFEPGDQSVGGLVGYTNNAKIDRCYAFGNATGSEHIGGLVGVLNNSSITNSAAFGTAQGAKAGALVGYSWNIASITNSVALGDAKGEDAGTFIGLVSTGVHNIKNTYGASKVSGVRNTGALIGRVDTGVSNSVSLKKVYYWKGSSDKGKMVGYGDSAVTSGYTPYKFDDNKEAVMDDDSGKLIDTLNGSGNDWSSATCNLKTGPGGSAPGDYTLPMPKVLGAVCK